MRFSYMGIRPYLDNNESISINKRETYGLSFVYFICRYCTPVLMTKYIQLDYLRG